MSPDRYTILLNSLRLESTLKATNFYCDLGIITTTYAVIVEHARVALLVVAVVILMSHRVGRKAEVARLRARRPILVVGARPELAISAENVVDHELGPWRLQPCHRSSALHLHRDGHPWCDVRERINFCGYKWAVVAHQSVPVKYDLETVLAENLLKVFFFAR